MAPSANGPRPQGRRIREAAEAEVARRTGKDATLKSVAREIGVEPHTLDRYMSGKTSPARQLWNISRVVRRSVEWLRGDDGANEMDEAQLKIDRYIADRDLDADEARCQSDLPPLVADEVVHDLVGNEVRARLQRRRAREDDPAADKTRAAARARHQLQPAVADGEQLGIRVGPVVEAALRARRRRQVFRIVEEPHGKRSLERVPGRGQLAYLSIQIDIGTAG